MMSVTVPEGYQIASISTSYTMTSQNNGYQSEQRTMLFCTTTGIGESSLASGSGNVGTYSYNRSNITIANGATGTVDFELRAWRTWQGSGDCNTTYNKVNNNTWTITITYQCVAPETPTADSQTVCSGSTVEDLTASANVENPDLRWYADETSEYALGNDAVLETGTYYVAQHVNTCESARLAVAVTVNTVAAPAAEAQTVCGGATVEDLSAEGMEGATLNWYATQDGEMLGNDAMLETGSYFVSQTVAGCESEKVEIAVTVNVTPAATTESTQQLCSGATVEDLFAEGMENATLNWYATADGEALGNDAVLETGSYFVSQSVEGCESEKTEVAVTVNPIPDAPTGSEMQDFTEGETIADLDIALAEGGEAHWFIMNESNEYVSVSAETALVDDMTYYVSQSVGGCESGYHAITANEVLGTTSFGLDGLAVYPNPATDIITIANKGIVSDVSVTNLLGQMVMSQKSDATTVQLNISKLAAGTYILKVQSEGKSATVKIVKQ